MEVGGEEEGGYSIFEFQDFRGGGGDGGWVAGWERGRKVIVLIVATDSRLWFKFQVSNLKARDFTPCRGREVTPSSFLWERGGVGVTSFFFGREGSLLFLFFGGRREEVTLFGGGSLFFWEREVTPFSGREVTSFFGEGHSFFFFLGGGLSLYQA